MKRNEMLFYQLLRDFLTDYLIARRNFSEKTARSYRQTLNLLRNYFKDSKNISFDRMDFSCFISKENFEDYVIPGLEVELDKLQASIYHLDGPGALRHLDRLLELEKLNGIQWVQGAGAPPAREWIQVYKKIQKAGKCIQAECEPEDIEPLCRELAPEGVHLICYAKTEQEAKDLIALAEKTCKMEKG